MNNIKHTRITPDIEADQIVRNDARRAEAIAKLGNRHLLHPANHVQRKDEARITIKVTSAMGKTVPFDMRTLMMLQNQAH